MAELTRRKPEPSPGSLELEIEHGVGAALQLCGRHAAVVRIGTPWLGIDDLLVLGIAPCAESAS